MIVRLNETLTHLVGRAVLPLVIAMALVETSIGLGICSALIDARFWSWVGSYPRSIGRPAKPFGGLFLFTGRATDLSAARFLLATAAV